MRDIDSSVIVLLIYGTVYLHQSSLAPVWLFLAYTKSSHVDVKQLFTFLCLYSLCVYYRPSIIARHVFYCGVSARLVLLLLIQRAK